MVVRLDLRAKSVAHPQPWAAAIEKRVARTLDEIHTTGSADEVVAERIDPADYVQSRIA